MQRRAVFTKSPVARASTYRFENQPRYRLNSNGHTTYANADELAALVGAHHVERRRAAVGSRRRRRRRRRGERRLVARLAIAAAERQVARDDDQDQQQAGDAGSDRVQYFRIVEPCARWECLNYERERTNER
jgi:hypothetical protein